MGDKRKGEKVVSLVRHRANKARAAAAVAARGAERVLVQVAMDYRSVALVLSDVELHISPSGALDLSRRLARAVARIRKASS